MVFNVAHAAISQYQSAHKYLTDETRNANEYLGMARLDYQKNV
jgi:hypothetical protein